MPPPAASNPDDDSAAAIQQQIAELQAKLARKQAVEVEPKAPSKRKKTATTRIRTDGGAAVQGAVKVHNGHFIGRDSIRIVNHIVNHIVKKGEDAEDAQLALATYLHALATDLAGLRLGDIDASTDQTRQTRLQLPDIYVPLNTSFSLPEGTSLEQALKARDFGEALLGARGRTPEMRPASALEALAACGELTLLGAPGSGKSTFSAHVLLALAHRPGRASASSSLASARAGRTARCCRCGWCCGASRSNLQSAPTSSRPATSGNSSAGTCTTAAGVLPSRR